MTTPPSSPGDSPRDPNNPDATPPNPMSSRSPEHEDIGIYPESIAHATVQARRLLPLSLGVSILVGPRGRTPHLLQLEVVGHVRVVAILVRAGGRTPRRAPRLRVQAGGGVAILVRPGGRTPPLGAQWSAWYKTELRSSSALEGGRHDAGTRHDLDGDAVAILVRPGGRTPRSSRSAHTERCRSCDPRPPRRADATRHRHARVRLLGRVAILVRLRGRTPLDQGRGHGAAPPGLRSSSAPEGGRHHRELKAMGQSLSPLRSSSAPEGGRHARSIALPLLRPGFVRV